MILDAINNYFGFLIPVFIFSYVLFIFCYDFDAHRERKELKKKKKKEAKTEIISDETTSVKKEVEIKGRRDKENVKSKKTAVVLLSCVLCISIAANAFQYVMHNQEVSGLNDQVSQLTSELDAANSTIADQEDKIEHLRSNAAIMKDQISEYKGAAEFLYQYIAIVPNDGSGKYHSYNCKKLGNSSFWAYNVEQVRGKYLPCSDCSWNFVEETKLTEEEEYYNQIVYVTYTGTCYHRAGCSYLKSSVKITLGAAIERGFAPCSKCNPPT